MWEKRSQMGQYGCVVKHNLTCTERGPDFGILALTQAKSDGQKCHTPPANHICHQTRLIQTANWGYFFSVLMFSVQQVALTCPEERDTIKWAVFSLVDSVQGKQIIIFAPGICCAEFPLQLLSIYYAFHGPPELDLKLKATKCNRVSLSTLWLVPCPKCRIIESIICLFVWDKANRECRFLLRKHAFLAQLHIDVSSRIFSHLSLSSVGRVVLASQFSLRFDNAQGKGCVSFKESPTPHKTWKFYIYNIMSALRRQNLVIRICL